MAQAGRGVRDAWTARGAEALARPAHPLKGRAHGVAGFRALEGSPEPTVESRPMMGLNRSMRERPAVTKPLRPDDLKTLADAAVVDADWVARAKAALIEAAEAWEWAELQLLDEIEIATFGSD